MFEEMDVDPFWRAVRRCAGDELAHTNMRAANTTSATRMSSHSSTTKSMFFSTMNVQHLESVTPLVHKITGIVVREPFRTGC